MPSNIIMYPKMKNYLKPLYINLNMYTVSTNHGKRFAKSAEACQVVGLRGICP